MNPIVTADPYGKMSSFCSAIAEKGLLLVLVKKPFKRTLTRIQI
jgi:hypothetical protein